MKVCNGSGDVDLVVGAVAETVGEAGLLRSEPAGITLVVGGAGEGRGRLLVVGNAHGIGLLEPLAGLLFDQVVEAVGSVFLHALKAHQ